MKQQTKQNWVIAAIIIVTIIAMTIMVWETSGFVHDHLTSATLTRDLKLKIASLKADSVAYDSLLKLTYNDIGVFTNVVDSLDSLTKHQDVNIQELAKQRDKAVEALTDGLLDDETIKVELDRLNTVINALQEENKILHIALDRFKVDLQQKPKEEKELKKETEKP